MSGAVVGIVVVIVIIVAAVAGYEAAASSITASTSTSTSTSIVTSTLPPVTSTITSTATSTATLTNTVSVSGTVTQTITGTVTTTQTSTSISTTTQTSTSTSTATVTTVAAPTLPAAGSSSLPNLPNPISEAGSSLVFPLFQLWAANFTTMYPNIKVNTAAGGSGAGQTGVEQNTINIGGSDPFLSNAQVQAYPNILNIAVAISAQQINYNVPGLTHQLNFTGNVLAGIYNGTITYWDAAAIKAINPLVASELPHALIVPLHRSDSSGDTSLFTTYLSDTSPDWAKNIGSGNTVAWPSIPTAQAENGNSGMLQAASQTQYSIGYIGISYLAQANTAGLGNAKLQNLAGNFVQITQANIESAVNAQYTNTPASERYSLIYGPGATSYPIVNYEYALVQIHQGSQALATDVQTLLDFATLPNYGNSPFFLNQVGFVPLPNSIAQLSWAQIQEITV
jgi:phosphate transport system substrate-binding protein